MRKIIIALLCAMLLTTVVFAQNEAQKVENTTSVSGDGSCQVTLTVQIWLDRPVTDLTFPVPAGAKGVTMNGNSARTFRSGDVELVDLSHMDGLMGNYTMTFHYSLDNIVSLVKDEKTGDEKMMLELPLLSGFAFPVKEMSFSVTLPSEPTAKPDFFSVYQQEGIKSNMEWTVMGQIITGTVTKEMNDHDTLSLILEVPPEMFPGKVIIRRDGNPEVVPMGICAALALVYWLIFMRTMPIFRQRRTTPLEGVDAGSMGSRLTLSGADLTMMVMSWAQLGYLRIHLGKNDRVMLYRRMDMGNERSAFENRCFQMLFSKGDAVEGTGTFYAKLCRKVAGNIPGIQESLHKRSGNAKPFRLLACGSSLFCGICLAMNLSSVVVLQVLLAIGLSILGAVTAWQIQGGMARIHLRGKLQLILCGICCGIWLLIGYLAGQLLIALSAVAIQLLAGLATAYGGRRSELGRYQACQILGLRRYLKTISREDIHRNMTANPEYFFAMMPYAMALGVDKKFADRFGGSHLPRCAYLTEYRSSGRRSALQWAQLLRYTVDRLDAQKNRMEVERWIPVSIQIRR